VRGSLKGEEIDQRVGKQDSGKTLLSSSLKTSKVIGKDPSWGPRVKRGILQSQEKLKQE